MALDITTKTTILIKGAIKGSQKAYSDLMDLYWDDVNYHLLKKNVRNFLIEDIAVIAFTKAFEKLESYNPEYSFKTWLLTIANNTFIDFVRQKKDSTISLDEIIIDDSGNEFTIDFDSGAQSPEEEFIDNQEMDIVVSLIKSVPETYSQILHERFVNHLSYKEISDNLGLPINLVKIRILRGRKILLNLIDKFNL